MERKIKGGEDRERGDQQAKRIKGNESVKKKDGEKMAQKRKQKR